MTTIFNELISLRSGQVASELSSTVGLRSGVSIPAPALTSEAKELFTDDLLDLLAKLHRELNPLRVELLESRKVRQEAFDSGDLPGYLSATEAGPARGEWRVAPLPRDLMRRRVEITGPVGDTKMVINMLSRSSTGDRADAAMLDFEDSQKPSWENVLAGFSNVIGAAKGTLEFVKPASGSAPEKVYRLDPDDMPLLMVRVRGLHLDEVNVRVDDEPISGGLFELATCVYHTARTLLDQGKTPKFYIPKCEHYLEARWWNTLFERVQEALNIPSGTIKATFLVETLPAAFQMEEILYEFRDHAAGLNGGRWDKIFSDIKVLKSHSDRVMADRASISMNRSWMKNYVLQLIKVCHRHGAFGMGGMAAFTPGRTPELREAQTRKVLDDKQFEASIGHDGCWVSHPYFIGPAMSAFKKENQLDVIPDIEEFPDLMPRSEGTCTLDGLRTNVRVGIAYMKGWNQDIGCVAWDDLMEDLATLEISRAQTWQWIANEIVLDCGTSVNRDLVKKIFEEETFKIINERRVDMKGAVPAVVEAEITLIQKAAADASFIFMEEEFRQFLTCKSDLAGEDVDAKRAHLRHTAGC
ncbi:MAG: malate synthase A [Rhodothermales bacterium]|nr:malate synthase A [Rhodothermales bacterium]